ncbi:MAG: DNA-directed RNA polymerase subunit beta [Candidatus Poribacteria bacterium]|nr:DNA-directed RNA polymerase subunit beta [Candidatus Poribacteria bacterium]
MPNTTKTNGSASALRQRVSFTKTSSALELPDLIETQKRSYAAFMQRFVSENEREPKGLQALFKEVFPIYDFKETTSLEFVSYTLSPPIHDLSDCQARGLNYQVRLQARLMCVEREKDDDTGQTRVLDITESDVYLGDIPLMTENGTFIINGSERVIVNQLHRSPGVIFLDKSHASSVQKLPTGQIIPYRGAWIEFEFDSKDCIHVRLDRKKKLLATVLLRALGWSTDAEILKLFSSTEIVPMTQDVIGRVIAEPVVDTDSGEVLLEANTKLSEIEFDRLTEAKVSEVEVLVESDEQELRYLRNTLSRDTVKAYAGGTLQEGALLEIFRTLRPGDAPTREAATACLERLFFDGARYDLGIVGRYKVNSKFSDMSIYLDESGEIPSEDMKVLRKEDIAATLQYLMDIRNGYREVDDLDHLGNRRVRVIGELLENQFRIALLQMRRAAREKLSTTTDAQLKNPKNLVNPKPLMMSLREFFGSNQLSQFMQQINPLDELTHKRRISAIGPGGLHRDRATAAVRDVHRTHYGRVCPLETPEGPSIGLIVSLATFARVNPYGFLETPYRAVRKGKITKDVEYLTADAEDKYHIAPADAISSGNKTKALRSRKGEEVLDRDLNEIDYIGIAPQQIVGVSASLVPFLEHEDANRALMGANHQRQAVPLIRPEAPWVGTGMEHRAARDANAMVIAQRGGVVSSVDAEEILIRTGQALHLEEGEHAFSEMGYDVYKLKNFKRSNSGTCIHQRPRVDIGDIVEAGDVIADGTATEGGELALGRNVLCAYMPWGGHNFEDSILISESLIKNDTFTSIHIEEFEVAARQTKMGDEEITRDIPNMSARSLAQLDDEGIIRIGSVVGTGSILVGKISPKGESEYGPEEKLLRAIFGEKVKEVKDASAYTRPGVEGVVIDVKVFSRHATPNSERTEWRQEALRKQIEQTWQEQCAQVSERLTEELRETLVNKELAYPTTFENDEETEGEDNAESPKQLEAGDVLTREYLDALSRNDLEALQITDVDAVSYIKNLQELATGRINAYTQEKDDALEKLDAGEELKPGVLKLVKVYVASRRPISIGDKMAGRYGNKGVVAKILPEEDMPYLPDGSPVDIVLNPLGVPSRMNVGQILEIHLGLACKELGLHVSSPVFDGATEEEVFDMLAKTGLPEKVKQTGKSVLYDGRTGEPFGQEVTVGYVYFLKLNHLVADKMHARSTGSYSLVTQQPLGGKAQHGGQRLGEMEVWALEAYGAAHTLQEMLTIKSDDVKGRTKIYESIVKGQSPLKPGTPESFNVLVRELQSLGLNVELSEGDPADVDSEQVGLHEAEFPLLHTLDTMEPIDEEPTLKLTWDTDDAE